MASAGALTALRVGLHEPGDHLFGELLGIQPLLPDQEAVAHHGYVRCASHTEIAAGRTVLLEDRVGDVVVSKELSDAGIGGTTGDSRHANDVEILRLEPVVNGLEPGHASLGEWSPGFPEDVYARALCVGSHLALKAA